MSLTEDSPQLWPLVAKHLASLSKHLQTAVVEFTHSSFALRLTETASTLQEEARDKLLPEPKFHHNIIFGVFTGIVLTSARLVANVRRKREARRMRKREHIKLKAQASVATGSFLDACREEYSTLKKTPNLRFRPSLTTEACSERLMELFTGMVISANIYVGDRFDLYKVLHTRGALSAPELSKITGFSERVLLEWLMQGASSQILEYDAATKKFRLKDTYAPLLLDPRESEDSMIGLFQVGPALVQRTSELHESLETGKESVMRVGEVGVCHMVALGVGASYDGQGKWDISKGIERMHYKAFTAIVPERLLPNDAILKGKLPECLSKGILVADVGCGTALLLLELAKRFPKSTFHGYELSKEAIYEARANVKRARLKNIEIFDVSVSPMPDAHYDFCLCYDVIHDCSNPSSVMTQVKKALKPNAPWLVVDIKSFQKPEENIARPGSAELYGFSVALCLQSGLSEPHGAGLGTCGLYPELFSEMARSTGFTQFTHFEVPELVNNSCYVLIP